MAGGPRPALPARGQPRAPWRCRRVPAPGAAGMRERPAEEEQHSCRRPAEGGEAACGPSARLRRALPRPALSQRCPRVLEGARRLAGQPQAERHRGRFGMDSGWDFILRPLLCVVAGAAERRRVPGQLRALGRPAVGHLWHCRGLRWCEVGELLSFQCRSRWHFCLLLPCCIFNYCMFLK